MKTWQGQFSKRSSTMRTLDPLTFESLLGLGYHFWSDRTCPGNRELILIVHSCPYIMFVCCQMIKCNLKGVKQCTMPAGKLFSIRLWQLFYVSVNSVRKTLIQYLHRFPFTKTTIRKTYRFYFWTSIYQNAHVLFSVRIKGSRAL